MNGKRPRVHASPGLAAPVGHGYPVRRIDEMPLVEARIPDSGEAPGGRGEPGVPPVAPAPGNAIFALTGKRIRELPIRPEGLERV